MKTLFAAVVASVVLFGCASQSELDEVRELATQANNTAAGAAQCCEQAHEKIDRMYTKIMTK